MDSEQLQRKPVFKTRRLFASVGEEADAGFFYRLWTEPRVMSNVGYPRGLPITQAEVADLLREQEGRILDSRLVVILKSTGQRIGECKLGAPDDAGLSTTDVKLFPEFWGNKYGVEIKQALVDYLFTHTDCQTIEATPNISNIASIKMQEAVGGVCVGERIYEVPESKRDVMQPVHSYVYHVTRDAWLL